MQRIDRRAITVVDVKADHAAIGDGTTDDTAAINAAKTAAGVNGTVFFPKGTYIVSTASTFVPLLSPLAGQSFIGEPGAILKLSASSGVGSYLIGVSVDDVTIDGLTIHGNGIVSAVGVHFRVTPSARGVVRNCTLRNFNGGSASAAIEISDASTDIVIANNQFFTNTYGVLTAANASPERVLICGNTFNHAGTNGDAVEINGPSGSPADISTVGNIIYNCASGGASSGIGIGYAHVTRGVIANNIVRLCGLDGIHVEDGSSDISVTGNQVYACGRSGIAVNSSNVFATRYTRGVAILGNTVDGCLTASGTGGIAIEGNLSHYDHTVIGNIVRACGRSAATCYGIDLQQGSNYRVIGNVASDTVGGTTAGFRLGAMTNVLIQGNRAYDDAGSPTQDHGISIQGNQVDLHVLDNDFTGNGTAGVDLASIGTTTRVIYRNNAAYLTEASGTGTINNGATSATVTHGLAVTPTRISVTLRENPSNDPGIVWVDTIGATTFAVNCRSDPGASNLDFAWKAEI